MKNGLAVVSKILLGVFVIFLGFGGYTGYSYFTDKDFNFYGLMPKGDVIVVEEVEGDIAREGEDITYADDKDEVAVDDNESDEDGSFTNLFFGGAVKARDMSKKADVNNLIMAIETYNNDFIEYPQKTACVDQMEELKEGLIIGDSIFEDGGRAVFETEDGSVSITCDSGYLYQSFGKGYVVWTTMENEENGNIQYFVTNQGDVVEVDEGKYFIFSRVFADPVEMLPFEGGDVAPVEKTGVSRGVSRSAN